MKSVKLIEIIKNVKKPPPAAQPLPRKREPYKIFPPQYFFSRCARPRCKLTFAIVGFAEVPGEIFLHPPKLFRRGTESGSKICREIFFSRGKYFFPENISRKFPRAARKSRKSGKMNFPGIPDHLPGENKYRLEWKSWNS